MNKKQIVGGLLAGALVGASAALLLAPDKGSATRKKIADQVKRYGSLKAEEIRDTIKGKLRRASNKVDEYHNDFQQSVG